jgi:hypothetical protein
VTSSTTQIDPTRNNNFLLSQILDDFSEDESSSSSEDDSLKSCENIAADFECDTTEELESSDFSSESLLKLRNFVTDLTEHVEEAARLRKSAHIDDLDRLSQPLADILKRVKKEKNRKNMPRTLKDYDPKLKNWLM